LPVPYFHVVFTLPPPIADIAYQNKAVIYDLLFKASAETVLTIAADPKHLGARRLFDPVLRPLTKPLARQLATIDACSIGQKVADDCRGKAKSASERSLFPAETANGPLAGPKVRKIESVPRRQGTRG